MLATKGRGVGQDGWLRLTQRRVEEQLQCKAASGVKTAISSCNILRHLPSTGHRLTIKWRRLAVVHHRLGVNCQQLGGYERGNGRRYAILVPAALVEVSRRDS